MMDLSRLSGEEARELVTMLEEDARRTRRRLIATFYPDEGPLRRELYPKHMEFFAAGAIHQERAFIAANRIGKSAGGGGYEMTLHLTGDYPAWWIGRRFDRPVTAWAAGEDSKAVRDTIQIIMLGQLGDRGTGLIPGDAILRVTMRSGITDAADTVFVKHRSGGRSTLAFKSYDQKRESFQGAKVDVMWFDEEPPMAIYLEGLTRTMATVPGQANGCIMCTMTPLKGISDVVLMYLPGGKLEAK
jgi:phage terminase large subunit-like protein